MDHCTIFYSWQSDVKANRNFISDCMKRLPQKLADFAAIEIFLWRMSRLSIQTPPEEKHQIRMS